MIKRLKELREAATPGPWAITDYSSGIIFCPKSGEGVASTGRYTIITTMQRRKANAALIVETINNLDKLIAVVEAVEIARRHSSDPSYLPDVWAAYAALEEE